MELASTTFSSASQPPFIGFSFLKPCIAMYSFPLLFVHVRILYSGNTVTMFLGLIKLLWGGHAHVPIELTGLRYSGAQFPHREQETSWVHHCPRQVQLSPPWCCGPVFFTMLIFKADEKITVARAPSRARRNDAAQMERRKSSCSSKHGQVARWPLRDKCRRLSKDAPGALT